MGLAQAVATAGLALWPNPLAAGLIGHAASSATVVGANQVGRSKRARVTRRGAPWFAARMAAGAAVAVLAIVYLARSGTGA